MSREHVELHRRVADAFNAGDVERVIADTDPSVEFHSTFAVMGGVYHGHDGMREFFEDFEDAWGDTIRLEPEAYFDLGEHTLAFHLLRGRGRSSSAEVALRVAHLCRWRDDRLIYFKSYADREDALRDLDVSEDELEPIDP